jgi:hypothetical protein
MPAPHRPETPDAVGPPPTAGGCSEGMRKRSMLRRRERAAQRSSGCARQWLMNASYRDVSLEAGGEGASLLVGVIHAPGSWPREYPVPLRRSLAFADSGAPSHGGGVRMRR